MELSHERTLTLPCPLLPSAPFFEEEYPKNKQTWEQTQTRRKTAWLVPRALLWMVLPHTHFWTRNQLLGEREGLSKQGFKGPEPPTLTSGHYDGNQPAHQPPGSFRQRLTPLEGLSPFQVVCVLILKY